MNAPWQDRYKRALRQCNIFFAALALLLPPLLLVFVYVIDKSGLCLPPSENDVSSHCSLLGIQFGDVLDSVLQPRVLSLLTLGCLLMSGVGSLISMFWGAQTK